MNIKIEMPMKPNRKERRIVRAEIRQAQRHIVKALVRLKKKARGVVEPIRANPADQKQVELEEPALD